MIEPTDDHDDEFDAEFERMATEPLRVEAVDPETGERVEGVVYRDHVAAALIMRDAPDR